MIEIRWHGRGGQGAKTAALLFAEACLSCGKYIQAFPEYGPERTGAPVAAYDRLSDEPISVHCGISEPDIVVVLDSTLIRKVDVLKGLSEDGILIVNSKSSPLELRDKFGIHGRKVYTVDASGISKDTLGRDLPNTPMLGAVAKVTGILDFQKMLLDIKEKLSKKFRNKDDIVEGNICAIKRAYNEVKGETQLNKVLV